MRGVLLTLMLVVASACSPSNDAVRPGEDGMSSGMQEDLAATMEVGVRDSEVRFGLHVTNTSDRPIEFTFPTSQRYEFVVRNEAGEEVWRWSEGMAFLQAVSHATLEPGESWDMQAVWDPSDREGEYTATGRLVAQDRPVEQSAAFRLP